MYVPVIQATWKIITHPSLALDIMCAVWKGRHMVELYSFYSIALVHMYYAVTRCLGREILQDLR